MGTDLTIANGSAMDGLDIDLIAWCVLDPLTDKQHDALWGTTTDINLIFDCEYVKCEATEGEEICRYTDAYYRFYVTSGSDVPKAQAQLKRMILKIIR